MDWRDILKQFIVTEIAYSATLLLGRNFTFKAMLIGSIVILIVLLAIRIAVRVIKDLSRK